ncbi:MAG: NAD(P)-binding protein [Planctomycetes bacterium]|nr:NAD(P)-binding protein [Planctomycetota bacterium]
MTPSGRRSTPDGGLTRRDFLAGSGALFLSGCLGAKRKRIEGEIVADARAHGHLLRGPLPTTPSRTVEVPVVVAGAGIAGLSAAWRLRRAGVEDFLVLELESSAGGNARWGSNAVTEFPWAAHYVPLPTRESVAVRELFRELGIIVGTDARGEPEYEERYLCAAPQERLFEFGRWHDGLYPSAAADAEDLAQLRRFRERMAEFRGKFAIPVERSSRGLLELDALTMRRWLDREGFTSPRLRWYVDYACRDDYGCTIDTTSAWAGIHYYASRPEDEEVVTWPAGIGWIARRLAAPLGRRLVTGALVARADGEGVDYLDTRTRERVRVRAKRVILALPRFVVQRVFPRTADGFTYAPWVVANVTVDRVPEGRGAPPCWDNVLRDGDSLGYVVATHQSLRTRPGPSVLTWYLPCTGDPASERAALVARPWEYWRDRVIADLRPAHPDIEERASRIDVMLLGHAMIRPVPGFVWGKSRAEAAARVGNVHFAHSDLSGLSLFEEAQYHGVRAAEEVLRAMGVRCPSLLG